MVNKDFYGFFNQEFRNELLEKEACRKKAAQQQIVGIILMLLAIVTALLIFRVNGLFAVIAGLLIFGFGAYFIAESHKFETALKTFFKQRLIPGMVKNLNKNLHYSHEGGIKKSSFVASKIFQASIDIFEVEDWVHGSVGQTEIEFSELDVKYITRDNKGNETKHTVFDGIFFIADFHKDFKGETFVLRDHAQKLFGNMGTFFQRINGSRPELILLENPVFEKQFVVYGTDQVESRYLITPLIMERMVEMNRAFKGIQFSFVDSKMFVAIPLHENLFEPKLHKSFHDTAYIEKYFHVLANCIGMVDTLQLNNRIWTKH